VAITVEIPALFPIAVTILGAAVTLWAQTPQRTANDGVFTEAQVCETFPPWAGLFAEVNVLEHRRLAAYGLLM
jgi:hypothetical protein